MARVHLKNVTKKFRKTVAVDDLTLCVEDKTFVVLLGPSGSGKSTVLNLIAGLEKPDKGEIYIGDELVNEKPPEKRDIAMVTTREKRYSHGVPNLRSLSFYDSL